MQSSDVLVVNNEFAFTNRGEPLIGKTFTFRASGMYMKDFNNGKHLLNLFAGMEAVRKDAGSYKGIVIRLYMDDPDTNKKVEVERATI